MEERNRNEFKAICSFLKGIGDWMNNRIKKLNEKDLERIIQKIELLEMKDSRLAKMKDLGREVLDEKLSSEEIDLIEEKIINLKIEIQLLEENPTLIS